MVSFMHRIKIFKTRFLHEIKISHVASRKNGRRISIGFLACHFSPCIPQYSSSHSFSENPFEQIVDLQELCIVTSTKKSDSV